MTSYNVIVTMQQKRKITIREATVVAPSISSAFDFAIGMCDTPHVRITIEPIRLRFKHDVTLAYRPRRALAAL